jgi:hypothetical protein
MKNIPHLVLLLYWEEKQVLFPLVSYIYKNKCMSVCPL